ncbi:MAG: MbnP family protein [Bacteroidia bacterium]
MEKIIILLVLVASLFFTSCKKDVKSDPESTATVTPATTNSLTTGEIHIQFNNVVDGVPLVFNTDYINPKGDSIRITKFNYFISNIIFTDTTNNTFVEPNSYHLVRHSDPASATLVISGVPFQSYKSLSFMLGVDSARNNSGSQTGALDPANSPDMYWNWSTGYIMVKLEGTSPKSSIPDKSIQYHIGGYGGTYKTQRSFSFNFGYPRAINSINVIPVINVDVNVNEFFKTPNLIDVSTQSSQVSQGPLAKIYADNYADMITFKNLHN